jgi:hypothetical protein
LTIRAFSTFHCNRGYLDWTIDGQIDSKTESDLEFRS